MDMTCTLLIYFANHTFAAWLSDLLQNEICSYVWEMQC